MRRQRLVQGLHVGVGDDELHAAQARPDHAVHRVAPGSPHSDDLEFGRGVAVHLELEHGHDSLCLPLAGPVAPSATTAPGGSSVGFRRWMWNGHGSRSRVEQLTEPATRIERRAARLHAPPLAPAVLAVLGLHGVEHQPHPGREARIGDVGREPAQSLGRAEAHGHLEHLLGQFDHARHERGAAREDDPAAEQLREVVLLHLLVGELEDLLHARLDHGGEHVPGDLPVGAAAHPGNGDGVRARHQGGQRAPVLDLDGLGLVDGRAQADGDVVGHVGAAERHDGRVADRALVEDRHVGGAAAEVEQDHAEVALVVAQHRVARGQRLEHEVEDPQVGALDGAADVLRRGHRAGDDVDLGLEPHAAHPHRVLDAVLVIHDVLLRDDVDDLAVHGDGDGLGRLDHPVHVGRADLVVPARDRDDAAAVDAADVVAGDAGVDALHRHARHALGFVHRALDAGDGLLEVHDHAPAQSLAGRGAHPHHPRSAGAVAAGVRDDAGDLRGADVQSDVRPCRLSHGADHPLLGVETVLAAAAGPVRTRPHRSTCARGARPRAARSGSGSRREAGLGRRRLHDHQILEAQVHRAGPHLPLGQVPEHDAQGREHAGVRRPRRRQHPGAVHEQDRGGVGVAHVHLRHLAGELQVAVGQRPHPRQAAAHLHGAHLRAGPHPREIRPGQQRHVGHHARAPAAAAARRPSPPPTAPRAAPAAPARARRCARARRAARRARPRPARCAGRAGAPGAPARNPRRTGRPPRAARPPRRRGRRRGSASPSTRMSRTTAWRPRSVRHGTSDRHGDERPEPGQRQRDPRRAQRARPALPAPTRAPRGAPADAARARAGPRRAASRAPAPVPGRGPSAPSRRPAQPLEQPVAEPPHVAGAEGEHQVAGAGLARHRLQRRRAVADVDELPLAERLGALDDGAGGHARHRRLARRVDVEHVDPVGAGEAAAELAVQQRRARVAVRLEQHQHPPAEGARRGQRRRHLGGVVAVVVHHPHAARLAARLEAPAHAGEVLERAGDVREGDLDLEAHRHRRQRVQHAVQRRAGAAAPRPARGPRRRRGSSSPPGRGARPRRAAPPRARNRRARAAWSAAAGCPAPAGRRRTGWLTP